MGEALAPRLASFGIVRRVKYRVVRHPMLAVFLVALAARVFTALSLAHLFSGRFVLDDRTYSVLATALAENDTENWYAYIDQLYHRTATFLIPLSLIYRVFPSTLAGRLFVALLGAATAVLAARLVQEGAGRRWGVIAGLIVALLPSQILFSSLVLKDPMVWMLLAALALTVAVAARTTEPKRLWGLAVILLLLLTLLGFLRIHTFIVATWAVALAAPFSLRRYRVQRAIAGVVLAVGVPILVGAGPLGIGFLQRVNSLAEERAQNARGAGSAFVDPDEVAPSRQLSDSEAGQEVGGTAVGGTAVPGQPVVPGQSRSPGQPRGRPGRAGTGPVHDSWAVSGVQQLLQELAFLAVAEEASTTDGWIQSDRTSHARAEEIRLTRELKRNQRAGADLAHLPTGIFVMLFEPIPWEEGGSASLRYARLEMIGWYALLACAVFALPSLVKRPHLLLYPCIVGVGSMLVAALTEGNIGSAYRHRGEFVWIVVVLATFGVVQITTWIRSHRSPARA